MPAGKSTLLNTATGSGVLAEDKLFATLDPTTRRLKLKSGGEVLLSDTVGFIQKLPTQLVAAFRSVQPRRRPGPHAPVAAQATFWAGGRRAAGDGGWQRALSRTYQAWACLCICICCSPLLARLPAHGEDVSFAWSPWFHLGRTSIGQQSGPAAPLVGRRGAVRCAPVC